MKRAIPILAAISLFIAGCGYTTRSSLGPRFKSIYVENFSNRIAVSGETTDERMYKGYRPGLETEITRAVADRFLSDGNLKVVSSPDDADLILKGELADFRKESLRYDSNNYVEEYRIKLITNLELKDGRTGKTVWDEKGFSGEATYRTSGSLAEPESDSIKEASSDLARRIVERTVEEW
jgi:hypothetical protein